MVLLEISNQEISACYCVPGYICSCDGEKNRPGSGKRNSKCSDPETKEAKVSKLMKNRLDPALAQHPHLGNPGKNKKATLLCNWQMYESPLWRHFKH